MSVNKYSIYLLYGDICLKTFLCKLVDIYILGLTSVVVVLSPQGDMYFTAKTE